MFRGRAGERGLEKVGILRGGDLGTFRRRCSAKGTARMNSWERLVMGRRSRVGWMVTIVRGLSILLSLGDVNCLRYFEHFCSIPWRLPLWCLVVILKLAWKHRYPMAIRPPPALHHSTP